MLSSKPVNHGLKLCLYCLTLLMGLSVHALAAEEKSPQKPNIIWLVLEDISLDLGTYGNKLVKTPNLDRLAAQGTKYTNAYATASVCSSSRSAFFTGMHQTSIGAHHHRSHIKDGYELPKGIKMLSQYLRDADYFNLLMGPKQKTDFNFAHHVAAFDAMDGELKYSGGAYTHAPLGMRLLTRPAWQQYGKDKPFFAQINYSETHRTFIQDTKNPIDANDVILPSYYPDHPIAKKDWALYLETIQYVDQKVGNLFTELEQAGVLDNTVVFIFGDHGRAMLRDKQWLYDGGIRVPLIVWGKGIAKGEISDELISLIDLAPTTMDMAGLTVPDYMEGHVFSGANRQPRNYIYAQRDRCDETDDRIRAVRDKRFKYIKNYFPERPYTQFNAYKKLQYPVMTLMQKLHQEGKLSAEQALFFAPTRPVEELFDTFNDPDEVNNLANNPAYAKRLKTMRTELADWQVRTGDQGMQAEDPAVVKYWDDFFAAHYKKQMELRGLSPDIDHDSYLVWWEGFLKTLGK